MCFKRILKYKRFNVWLQPFSERLDWFLHFSLTGRGCVEQRSYTVHHADGLLPICTCLRRAQPFKTAEDVSGNVNMTELDSYCPIGCRYGSPIVLF
jgi:hypothetical protein